MENTTLLTGPHEANPFLLDDFFAPVAIEAQVQPSALQIEGHLPPDLEGVFVRNGPNPAIPPQGRYHWFDGDGMLHALHFSQGSVSYCNRYIQTAGLAEERERGQPIWRGIREAANRERREQPFKDTSNTDVKFHAGSLITSWYLCGTPYRLDPLSLETLGADTRFESKVSAHLKVDEVTGELMFFDYGIRKPFMTYGVMNREGVKVHHVPIDLPGPRLPHDMAITEHYSILMDLPVFQDMDAARNGRWKTDWHPQLPARFGVIPRHGKSSEIRWFEASSCYIYHSTNAWEEDGQIVLEAYRYKRPFADYPEGATEFDKMLLNNRIAATLVRYRMDLRTGACTEEELAPDNGEFGMVDQARVGRPTRYVYGIGFDEHEIPIRFASLKKWDTTLRKVQSFAFDAHLCGSEPQFARRPGATREDDGYVIVALENNAAGRGEVWVFDAQSIETGPTAKVLLPVRLPAGFHGVWVRGDQLHAQAGH
jgi:carotenoid cleavage dioxygenase-like enzyme